MRNIFKSLLISTAFAISSVNLAYADPHLNFAWPVNVGPLNPHLYAPNQMAGQTMVYEPLVRYMSDGTVKPWLAESWNVSEDGKTYIFTLREDVKFSNGEKFDAAAAKVNFDAILANRERHAWLELANQIIAVEDIAPNQLKITLKDAYYPILQELALPRPFRFIAPSQFKEGGTKDGIVKAIGTGPWVFADSRLSEKDEFVRNELYWGKKPVYESITFKVIPDPNTRAVAFETGEIDLLYGTDGIIYPDTYQRFKNMPIYNAKLSEPLETLVLAINTKTGPTRDLAVRQAINHAVDKDKMIEKVLHGTQLKADTLFSENVPYADAGLKPYTYNLDEAKLLLDNAGWTAKTENGIREKSGEPLVVELNFVGTDAVAKSIAEVVQADLRRIGVDVKLVGEEESSIYSRQKDGRFGMIFNGTWGAPFDPHAFVSSMRIPSHADYQAQQGLADKAQIDEKITQVLTTTNEDERRHLYHDIFTRLHEEAVYLPLTYITAIAVSKPELGDIPFSAMSNEIPFDQLAPVTK